MAQFGSALGLGPRGRRFKSCRPDHVGMDFAPFRFFFAEKSVICFVIPPYSQKGTLGSPVLLQALSRRFAVATTFLRECFRHKYLYSSAFTLLCHSSSIPQNLLDFARVPCGTVILNFTMFFTKSCKNTCTKNRQTKRFADYIFLFRFHYSLKSQLNVHIICKKSRLYRLLICKRSRTYFVYS